MVEDLGEQQEEGAGARDGRRVFPAGFGVNKCGEVVDLSQVDALLGEGFLVREAKQSLTDDELADLPEKIRRAVALTKIKTDDVKVIMMVKEQIISKIISEGIRRRLMKGFGGKEKDGRIIFGRDNDHLNHFLQHDRMRKADKYPIDWSDPDADDENMVFSVGGFHSL